MKSDDELLAELKRASRGLLFMSESDYPFETVHLDGKTELSPQRLRALAGSAGDAPIEARSVDDFFGTAISQPDWKSGQEISDAQRYLLIVRLLKENLTDLRVYKIGEINIPVFIIGKSAEGNWLGLTTRVVET